MPEFRYDAKNPGPCCQKIDDMICWARPIVQRWPYFHQKSLGVDIMPDFPEDDPEEWDRRRKEEWEAKLAPFKALRQTINEHDELMAETLYEVTLLELGETEE